MRMRTIEQAHAELLAADPGCAIAKTALRRMVVSGQVPSCRMGTKYLIDLDRLPDYLFPDSSKEGQTVTNGIRRLEARL